MAHLLSSAHYLDAEVIKSPASAVHCRAAPRCARPWWSPPLRCARTGRVSHDRYLLCLIIHQPCCMDCICMVAQGHPVSNLAISRPTHCHGLCRRSPQVVGHGTHARDGVGPRFRGQAAGGWLPVGQRTTWLLCLNGTEMDVARKCSTFTGWNLPRWYLCAVLPQLATPCAAPQVTDFKHGNVHRVVVVRSVMDPKLGWAQVSPFVLASLPQVERVYIFCRLSCCPFPAAMKRCASMPPTWQAASTFWCATKGTGRHDGMCTLPQSGGHGLVACPCMLLKSTAVPAGLFLHIYLVLFALNCLAG